MISRIALALTVAAIATSAAAQSSRKQTTWDDLLKPVEVKTNPAIPLAPPQAAQPAQPAQPAQVMPTVRTATTAPEITTALKDACVVKALSRLPNIDGMRVTHSSWEFYKTDRDSVLGNVFVSVEVRGHQAQYTWLCGVSADGIIVLVALR